MCAHDCGADRRHGPAGRCRAGDEPQVFSELVTYGEEPFLVPAYAVSFAGCNLRCAFCITGRESWNAAAGAPRDLRALARDIIRAHRRREVSSAIVLGGEPTIHLPHALDLAGRVRRAGVPVALKTNGYLAPQATARIACAFDWVVVDLKFGDDSCARRLAGVERYGATLGSTLTRLAQGPCGLAVRHLVMPGHVECCWAGVAATLATLPRSVHVSLRDHYVPAWHATGELLRVTSPSEARRAGVLARASGLEVHGA